MVRGQLAPLVATERAVVVVTGTAAGAGVVPGRCTTATGCAATGAFGRSRRGAVAITLINPAVAPAATAATTARARRAG
jgi:hypothetical protein